VACGARGRTRSGDRKRHSWRAMRRRMAKNQLCMESEAVAAFIAGL